MSLGAAGWCCRFATGTLGVVEFFTSPDLWVAFLTLFVLEVVLGVDNVVFISILAGKLPPEQQRKARLLGLSLAMFLRIGLLFLASWIVGLTPLFGIGSAEALQFSGRDRKTVNVIADSPKGKNEDETIIVGAYRDSVLAGPGIIDNGSGSSTILEIAEEMAELGYTEKLRRQVRFAFWGAEEFNLLGSEYYVSQLSPAQQAKNYANLNFDMLASTNYVRFVYDGDGSDTGTVGPPGSDAIEQIFTSQGLASEPTAFDGRSDYGPFIAVGIPAGGCSAARRASRRPSRQRPTVAPPVRRTIPATTRPATTSPT
jgi:Peptidase family M28/Integral membrane protein TerC family